MEDETQSTNVGDPSCDPTTFRTVLDVPLEDLPQTTIKVDTYSTPCRFRLLDCNAFLDSSRLSIVEYLEFSLRNLSFAAISYPWRDLQMPTGLVPSEGSFGVYGAEHADGISINVLRTACVAALHFGTQFLWLDRLCILQKNKEDKNWQIQRMFQIYRDCKLCLVFPGGLVRLAELTEPTTWIDRAWTLQEAAANSTVKIIFSFRQNSFAEFVQGLAASKYPPKFLQDLTHAANPVQSILEPGRSAASDVYEIFRLIRIGGISYQRHHPELSKRTPQYKVNVHIPLLSEGFPVRILDGPAAALLERSLKRTGRISSQSLWMSAFVRTSSRPVDMVLSFMDLLGVNLPVSQFHSSDRTKATIKLIQALMDRGESAIWLFIAPEMPPSTEISTLPAMPETSVSGRAIIRTPNGRVNAFEAVGMQEPWKTEGAPRGVMTDLGYFRFHAQAALVVGGNTCTFVQAAKSADKTTRTSSHYEDTWAVVIGSRKELNRDPVTGRLKPTDASAPRPEGINELTLMFVEKHGDEVFHRVGMEREIDAAKTSGWKWISRNFSVGGRGRGERLRFTVSEYGPVRA